jgi:DNA-binding SARP family transcriptional activator
MPYVREDLAKAPSLGDTFNGRDVGSRLEFRILGPLEVRLNGAPVRVGGPKQRALLALLLCNANRVVSRDQLIDELLADQPAGSAEPVLHVQISRLRKVLTDGDPQPRLLARPPGYVLRVEDGELDLRAFEQQVAAGRWAFEQEDPGRAAVLLRAAESLWHGRPLADLEFEPFARFEVQRLEACRLAVVEDRIEAELALGRHGALSPELERLVAEHPLRERLRGQLMIALYRSGRQTEALETYRAGPDLSPRRPDRDEDRDHAVAECLKPLLGHVPPWGRLGGCRRHVISGWPGRRCVAALVEGEDDALVDLAGFQLAVGVGGLLHGHRFVHAQADPEPGVAGDRFDRDVAVALWARTSGHRGGDGAEG